MAGILENALLLGLGTLSLAKQETETLLRDALKRHNIPDGECDSIVKAVTEEGAKTQKALAEEVDKILKSRGASLFPGYERLEKLEARVAELEAKLAALETAK